MNNPKTRKPLAPTAKDLSYASVENSWAFGFTNLSGKALSTVSFFGMAVPGTYGLGQYFLSFPAVIGYSFPLLTSFGLLGGSVAGAFAAHALGNMDDVAITNHNRNGYLNKAKARQLKEAEDVLVHALQNIEYNPHDHHLPKDILGIAVVLPDEKIKQLPAHIQVDIYRTQADLALYSETALTMAGSLEYRARKQDIVLNDASFDGQAKAFLALREDICERIVTSTLNVTPVSNAPMFARKKGWFAKLRDGFSEAVRDYEPVNGSHYTYTHIHWGNIWSNRSSGGAAASAATASLPAPTSGGFGGDGGFVTGGGFGGEGGFLTGGGFGGGTSSSGPTSGSRKSNNNDIKLEGMGQAIIIVAAVALVAVAVWAHGRSLMRNWVHNAPEPEVNGVKLPELTRALRSAEQDIRHMYKPK